MILPRYPIYIPSKGRADKCLTAHLFQREFVPFRLVVEPQEHKAYADAFGDHCVLRLPFENLGQGSIPARNWIKAHATAEGHKRHWQVDDNILFTARRYKGKNIYCDSGPAYAAVEDFADRYKNVAIAGLNYEMFILKEKYSPPFHLNGRVYSCSLILNSLPHEWRNVYNEDTDICLQVLADGWCTILVNAFMVKKMTSMLLAGGNTDELYQGDGRLKMARSLERLWPGVVTTQRRYGRPQHVVDWSKFDTPLQKCADAVDGPGDRYNMALVQQRDIKSESLRKLKGEWDNEQE